jgi:predicted peptidase
MGEAQSDIPHTSAEGLPYLVTPPDGYDGESAAPPVLVFLHGGDRSNTRHHPARYAAQAGIDFPFLVVAPHCASGCSWGGVDFRGLLAEVADAYRIDLDRVYLTGYSMGGYGAWSQLTRDPGLFAAAAPIAGGGTPGGICPALGVPVRAYHGDQDNVIAHERSVEMVEALNDCGGTAELITLEGVDHGSWIPTFRDPAFYRWLLSHRR